MASIPVVGGAKAAGGVLRSGSSSAAMKKAPSPAAGPVGRRTVPMQQPIPSMEPVIGVASRGGGRKTAATVHQSMGSAQEEALMASLERLDEQLQAKQAAPPVAQKRAAR